ncbi:serine hydrolase [Aquabacter sp. CN5-332]|uniref:serine hydrolase n=1 Tax=Aquabacter sp. CN5-332 TaxID=3156608 RepID=UPI0032B36E53
MRMALANGTFSAKLLAAALAASLCFTASVAEAKPKKQAKAKSTSSQTAKKNTSDDDDNNTGTGWRRGQAAIIIDGNTGKVLYEDNPDSLRHPASVTKVMTLYMLFEQLEAGRLKLDSELVVSQRAAAQSPSKLNLRPGATIEVEDAIKAIVTRSANDVAVVIAEAIGGDEATFATMMTRKARALGMENTQFRNASGLPNKGQLTTARDLATLGLAIQDRFPKQYKYFSTRTFYYRGEAIANHNRMFGRIEGVDGIKTGYTNASGFNLLTSVHDDDKFLIGVVLGGSSGGSRDARMANLITSNLGRAYAGRRTMPKTTEVAAAEPAPAAAPAPAPAQARREAATPVAPLPSPQRMAYAADPVTTAAIAPRSQTVGSTEPIKPTAVKTTAISRPPTQALPAPTFTGAPMPPAAVAAVQAPAPVPLAPAPVAAVAPPVASAPVAAPHTLQAQAQALTPAPAQQPVRTASAGPVALPASAMPAATPVRSETPAASHRPGWMIQIGAFGGEKEAKSQLDLAQSKAKSVLGGAQPFVEKASKGSSDIYRARFAGLDEKGAKEACRLLQRNDFACMTLRN